MTKLYQITNRCDKTICTYQHVHDRNGYRRHWQAVEPCKHGRIDKHVKSWTRGDRTYWCEGAEL